eukprot:scaffold698_cov127-Isochrysis_galbana.AAC.3
MVAPVVRTGQFLPRPVFGRAGYCVASLPACPPTLGRYPSGLVSQSSFPSPRNCLDEKIKSVVKVVNGDVARRRGGAACRVLVRYMHCLKKAPHHISQQTPTIEHYHNRPRRPTGRVSRMGCERGSMESGTVERAAGRAR